MPDKKKDNDIKNTQINQSSQEEMEKIEINQEYQEMKTQPETKSMKLFSNEHDLKSRVDSNKILTSNLISKSKIDSSEQ